MPHAYEPEFMKENLRLRRELEDVKRRFFSKKGSGILYEGDRLTAYRFIDEYHPGFGIRWLLTRLKIYSNVYYNYWKHRKADYYTHKSKILTQREEIYHEHHGV